MAIATGARSGITYIAESTFGTTPGTPAMIALRVTGSTIELGKEGFQSEELREDRQIGEFRHGMRSVTGDINFELAHGVFDDFLEAVLGGTWTSEAPTTPQTLKAGTTSRSFSIERRFTDIDQYQVFTGCAANTLSLSVSPNAIVTGSVGLLGRDMTVSGTTLDSSPTAAPANAPLDSFSGTLNEDGSAIATVTGIELSIDNGISPAQVIGADTTPELVLGRSNVTGTMTAYFEDASLLDKFVNETESTLDFKLDDPDGTNHLKFTLPRIKYTGASIPVDGQDSITVSLPFQALYDTTDATNIIIERSNP